MKFNRHHDIQEAEFDLTAMIDVVFLLIIFFMLSSTFAKIQLTPMPLPDQPGEEQASFDDAERTLIVDIAQDGTLSVLDVGRVSSDDLLAIVEKSRRTRDGGTAELDLIVRAHRDAAAGYLNRLAGTLARAGVRNWRLATSGGGTKAGGGS